MANCSNISNILFAKRILENLVMHVVLGHCFIYLTYISIFDTFVPKSEENSQICQGSKRFQCSQIVLLKALLSKNRLYFFCLILWHTPISLSIEMPHCRLTSSFNSFLSALSFSSLVCQAKSLIIIVKVNAIKIYMKNTHFITIKYNIWHEGVLLKLYQYGISGNLLKLLTNFLKNRKQTVTLNGQTYF